MSQAKTLKDLKKGEYAKYFRENYPSFKTGNLYQLARDYDNKFGQFIDEKQEENGFFRNNEDYFVVPTQEELDQFLNTNNINNKTIMKKTVTKNDVELVAREAIEANGETTTLEVKTELRARDFFAEQATVSSFVNELVKEGILKITGQNGLYRTYELEGQTVVSSDSDNDVKDDDVATPTSITTPSVSTPVTNINHRNGSVGIAKPIPSALTKKDDWEVSSVAVSDVLYFLGHLTRDEVRSAYAKLTGSAFANTRSGRLA